MRSEMAGAIKAVGTDFALGEPNRFDEDLERVELEAGESQSATYLIDHSIIARRVRLGIFLKDLYRRGGFGSHTAFGGVALTLEVADDLSRDELEV